MSVSLLRFLSSGLTLLLVCASNAELHAQVHYHEDGHPWKQRAGGGPDAEVDGWYYNLGITGLRAQLIPDAPKHLLVKHVFAKTPAAEWVHVGDVIVGAGGKPFASEHRNGYGMEKFGPHGPILEFTTALEQSQTTTGRGELALSLVRDGEELEVQLQLGQKYGPYETDYPADCRKTEQILEELYEYLVEHQREDGSWGSPPRDTFAPLALLASGDPKYLPAVMKNARMHARTTSRVDESSLINWRYMSAGIVLSEYYLSTGEEWALEELEEVYAFLISSQYTDLDQVDERVKETHPDAYPKDAEASHGGWGHNPGFEGYGPICMLTGQGALTFSLMRHCGIPVDRVRHDAAFAFLERGTGRNGYVWYGDQKAGDDDWADMGRTGATGVANWLSPYQDTLFEERALSRALVIGEHPESFPDTHGSPIMGMGYAALAANADPASFRKLMDANRWWFTLAHCADGSFYYQPNRDNAGYGADSRLSATAVTAFIFSIPKANLYITGKVRDR